MTSHIDCEDLLALAASCSVDEQLNADLRNQISVSLLCHIAQASASHHGTTPSFAPATTPIASSFAPSSSNVWISDEAFYNAQHHARRRESSVARGQSRYQTIEDNEMRDDTDNMQMEQDDAPINPFAPHNGEYGRVSGKHSEASEPVSLFATSDPFYLAVQELQAASQCRRQLQPKAFSVNTPLQVTPNPIQFGTLNAGQGFGQHFGMSVSNAGAFDRRGPTTIPMDAPLMQYR